MSLHLGPLKLMHELYQLRFVSFNTDFFFAVQRTYQSNPTSLKRVVEGQNSTRATHCLVAHRGKRGIAWRE